MSRNAINLDRDLTDLFLIFSKIGGSASICLTECL
jgi:hypothetical protein